MKLIFTLVIGLFVSGGAFAAESPIEFRGLTVSGGTTKLLLIDKTTDTTRWVEVGQPFASYRVKAYDAQKKTATLTKDGKELQLLLNASPVAEAASTLSEEIVQAIRSNLRTVAEAANKYYSDTRKKSVTVAELVGPDKPIKQLKSIAGENYDGLQLTQQEEIVPEKPYVLSVVTQTGVKVDYEVEDFSFVQVAPDVHVVERGDTAAKIAKYNGITLHQLEVLNPNVDWSRLKSGQVLKVK